MTPTLCCNTISHLKANAKHNQLEFKAPSFTLGVHSAEGIDVDDDGDDNDESAFAFCSLRCCRPGHRSPSIISAHTPCSVFGQQQRLKLRNKTFGKDVRFAPEMAAICNFTMHSINTDTKHWPRAKAFMLCVNVFM